MHARFGTFLKLRVIRIVIPFVMTVAILANTLAAPSAFAAAHGAAAAGVTRSPQAVDPPLPPAVGDEPVCTTNVFPIAIHQSSIANIPVGGSIGDVLNGVDPGNFGWLSWTGDASEPALVTSLTPPGNVTTYVNPSDATDHTLVDGKWVFGRPGVANSSGVRGALDTLKTQDITVPVWDQATGNGSNSQYHVMGFAQIRITAYQLPGDNRITANYIGNVSCGTPPPTTNPPPGPSLTGATLALSPSVAGPNVTGAAQTMTVSLKDRAGNPIAGVGVRFAVTGANTASGGGTTDAHGATSFTYQSSASGTDTVQATATSNGTSVTSNSASVSWVTPAQTVSTTTLWGRFFPNGGSCLFNAGPSSTPAFTQAFPTIDFNPPAGTVPGAPGSIGVNTRPMEDVTTDLNGNFTGAIVAQGTDAQGVSHQAGAGDLFAFDSVFTGAFTVGAAGDVTFNLFTDDGFILGIGNGATRVSGANVNPPASGTTAFTNLPVMGAFNTITAPIGNTVTVHFPAPGSYPYELDYTECAGGQLVVTVANGTQGVTPTGALTLSPNAVANQAVGTPRSFTATATDASGKALANLPVVLVVTGANSQQIQATTDATGTATFTYTGANSGSDTVQAIGWIGNLSSFSAQVVFSWTPPPTPPATPPSQTPGWIGGPANQSTVSGSVPITLASNVTLQAGSGTVDYWPAANPAAVTTLATGVSGAGGATLATLDTTTLANGSYIIRLQGTDSGGNQLISEILITAAGENKPGRVTFSVTDLTVPVTGMPITIGRTYDSLNRDTSGDFGNGWALSLGSPKLESNPAHDVTLTMPDGRRVTFFFTPKSVGGIFGYLLTPGYTPEAGTFGSLTSDGCGLLVSSGGQIICFLAVAYAPTTYTYTDPNGRAYVMSASGGLKSLTDLNGNTLTFSASGITSSAGGVSVPFTRDAQGRITQITDPAGQVYSYGYDAAGNLTSVTLPGVTRPVSYTYDAGHLLLSAADPRGNTAVTTTYDASGRLASVTDALGNKTSYRYDLTANTTTITAPDGGVTVNTYDSFGTLTKQVDPLGHTTTYAYDANHNLTLVTDALGNKTGYTYDSLGNRTSTTDPLGKVSSVAYNQFGGPVTLSDAAGNSRTVAYDSTARPTTLSDTVGTQGTFTWDSRGNLLTRTNGNGQATSFSYDAFGNLLSQTDPLGHAMTSTYDALGRKLSETDALGNKTTYSYDALGHLLTVTDPLLRVTTYAYDANGNQISLTDPAGRTTSFAYDAANRLVTETYPDLTTTRYTYDFRGNPLTETDQAGHVTQYAYDTAGQQTSVTTAAGTLDAATTSFGYDAAGRQTKVTDPLGRATTYAFDTAGYVQSVTDPLGHVTTYTHTAAGQEASQTDPLGHVTSYSYDARSRLVTTTYADGTTTQHSYDGAGNLLTSTDPAGKVTTYSYDAAGHTLAVTDALGHKTSYAYDADGNLLTITDANLHQTSFGYDALNRQISKTWPNGAVERFGFDLAGNQTSHTLSDGHVTSYAHDALDQLTKITYFDATTVGYTYTANGLRASVVDGRGTTTYAYDHQDRVTAITQPDGRSVGYSYDAAGERTGMTTPAGTTASTYDAAGRLVSVAAPGVGTTSFGYDAAGNPTSRALPNGITVSFGYDTLNRLTSAKQTAGTTTLASYSYTLGAAGNRTKVVEADGTAVAWTYDAAYHLTGETVTNPAGVTTAAASYAYDAVGNRTSLTTGGVTTTSSYNTLDQLTSAATGNQTTTYTYDGRGNLTGTSSGNGVHATTATYTYDAADRLTGASLSSGFSASYGYDADGRRVKQTVGTSVTNYLWDEESPSGDIVLESDGSGAVQASEVLGGSTLLAQVRGTTASYVLPDGQGSVRALANAAGAITDTYRYDAYGTLTSSTGTTSNSYRYDGQRQDDGTGLYQLRARSYDPGTGRFLSRDTAAMAVGSPAELNRYVYAHDDPIDLADPSGHAGAVALPAPKAGGTFGEYVSLLFNSLILALGLVVVAKAADCLTKYVISVVMAVAHDGDGLLAMDAADPGEPPRCHIPVLKYPALATPHISAHIVAAENGFSGDPRDPGFGTFSDPQPMLLSYVGLNNPQKKGNYNAACNAARMQQLKGYPDPNREHLTSCDEYPFESSQEGGPGASTRGVPPSEQRSQGGLVNAFYSSNGFYKGPEQYKGEGRFFAVVVVLTA